MINYIERLLTCCRRVQRKNIYTTDGKIAFCVMDKPEPGHGYVIDPCSTDIVLAYSKKDRPMKVFLKDVPFDEACKIFKDTLIELESF